MTVHRRADLRLSRTLGRRQQIGGLNHLLVPAVTGEVSEYGSLSDKTIPPVVTTTIADWLRGTRQMK